MAGPKRQGDLFPESGVSDGTRVVNDRCLVRSQDGHRVVLVAGIVSAQYTLGDRMAEAHAMVSLVEQGWADQCDVARVFECSTRTLRRHQRRFEEGGLSALGRGGGYPSGRPRLAASRARLVGRLKGEGIAHHEIARRLGVSPKAIRKLLRRLGWKPQTPEQVVLPLDGTGGDPNLSGFSPPPVVAPPAEPAGGGDPNLSGFPPAEDLPPTWDTDPADRRIDRVLACCGLLDDAAPLFQSGGRVPRAGVLLALPALVESGVLDIARKVYGSIGPAFYGLRTSILALLLLALLRIKRPEALKEHSPPDLGRLLGLDRAPEVKTLRRKLARLAALGQAAEFGHALAEQRVAARGSALGFLYVDGHVRVYHGKRTLPKAHVARMRIAMPATSDYWVNDQNGDPFFVVTAQANAGMVKMLPIVLAEVRALIGERRVTIVFDRGGYSPALFQTLITSGFDILTYRKGRSRRVPKASFQKHQATVDGHKVEYLLADQGVRLLGGRLRLRQVTRLSDDHQTPILTSRRDLSAIEVAYWMFGRWRQENFFKYLREEYALDALIDYGTVPDDPTREVPNPVWNAADAKLRAAREELAKLQAAYGVEALTSPEALRPTLRGFKIAAGAIGKVLRKKSVEVSKLAARRARIPRRVPVGKAVGEQVIKLAPEKKHLTSLLKMVAYQAESDLCRLVAPHYPRAEDEGRTLIQTALAATADIEVTDQELRITLVPLSSPHRTRAIAAVCEKLNRTPTIFPGSRLRLRYAVTAPP